MLGVSIRRSQPREIQLALFLLGEAAWLAAWAAGLGTWLVPSAPSPLINPFLVFAILIAGALVARLVLRWNAGQRLAPVALMLLGLVVALGTSYAFLEFDRPVTGGPVLWSDVTSGNLGVQLVAAFLLALLAWWRGIVAGRTRLSVDAVESGFRRGTVALIVLFLANVLATAGTKLPVGTLTIAAIVVVFVGLVSVPLARLLDLADAEKLREGPALGVSRHWLVLLLTSVAALLIFSLLFAVVFTFDRLDRVLGLVSSVLDAIIFAVVYIIALPLGYLVELLVDFFRQFLHPQQPPKPIQPLGPNALQQLRDQATQGSPLAALFFLILKWTLVVVVIVVVLVLIARAVTKVAEKVGGDDADETRDFVWTWAGLRQAVLEWLWSFLRRHQPRPALAPSVDVDVSHDGHPLNPRELYRELLRLGARAGRRRAVSETPGEYEAALVAQEPFVQAQPDVDQITAVYVAARYAADLPDTEATAAARDALDRLKRLEPPQSTIKDGLSSDSPRKSTN